MIARLLHCANAQPPLMFKREFYALKERLLERWGTRDGFDVQHCGKNRSCWTCGGTGIWQSYGGDYICNRCGGSGWYTREKWVTLERFRFGRFTFHVPRESTVHRPEPDVTRIEGYVQHAYYGIRSDHAFAWLCLLCGEWRLFWRWITSSRPCGWKWHPLDVSRQVICPVVWGWRERRRR